MNRRLLLLPAAFAFLLGACGGDRPATDAPGTTAQTAAPEATPARMEAGVQVADIAVEAEGFRPERVALRAGVPARLVFTRKTDGTCATNVQAPTLGVAETALPLGEPVAVTFTPSEAGTFVFGCGMDMVKGAVIVSGG